MLIAGVYQTAVSGVGVKIHDLCKRGSTRLSYLHIQLSNDLKCRLRLTELCSPFCTSTPNNIAQSAFNDGVLPLLTRLNGLYLDVSLMRFLG